MLIANRVFYEMAKQQWGYELIVDVRACDVSKFTKANIAKFTTSLVQRIKMKRSSAYKKEVKHI